jgi:hypothetical protein
MNELDMLKLFIIATSCCAIIPLLPTAQRTTLPLFNFAFVMASTALSIPCRATGSVSYNRATCDIAVAVIDSTLTAPLRMCAPSGSSAVVGGVTGIDRFRFLQQNSGASSAMVSGEGRDPMAISETGESMCAVY